jgi:hypothetical protein
MGSDEAAIAVKSSFGEQLRHGFDSFCRVTLHLLKAEVLMRNLPKVLTSTSEMNAENTQMGFRS